MGTWGEMQQGRQSGRTQHMAPWQYPALSGPHDRGDSASTCVHAVTVPCMGYISAPRTLAGWIQDGAEC